MPGIFHGHNESGAWGATYTVFDNVDVYVETITTPPDYPASPRTVLFNGRASSGAAAAGTVQDQGQRIPRTSVIEVVPHHGPMLPDPESQ